MKNKLMRKLIVIGLAASLMIGLAACAQTPAAPAAPAAPKPGPAKPAAPKPGPAEAAQPAPEAPKAAPRKEGRVFWAE